MDEDKEYTSYGAGHTPEWIAEVVACLIYLIIGMVLGGGLVAIFG